MTTSALARFQGMGGFLDGLKSFVLGLLALWYALLATSAIQGAMDVDTSHPWSLLEGSAWTVLQVFSFCLVLGSISAWSQRRAWLIPSIAAASYAVLEATHPMVAWRLGVLLPMVAVFCVWTGLATLMSLVLRRWMQPPLRRRRGLHVAIVCLAGLGTGVAVLLQPHKLQLLLNLYFAFWPEEWPNQGDGLLVLYYSLGGLAAGFTLRLLWPLPGDLPKPLALILLGCWCALAVRTLIDPVTSRPWLGQAQPPASVAVLLLPIAASILAGLWLARGPSRWSRHG